MGMPVLVAIQQSQGERKASYIQARRIGSVIDDDMVGKFGVTSPSPPDLAPRPRGSCLGVETGSCRSCKRSTATGIKSVPGLRCIPFKKNVPSLSRRLPGDAIAVGLRSRPVRDAAHCRDGQLRRCPMVSPAFADAGEDCLTGRFADFINGAIEEWVSTSPSALMRRIRRGAARTLSFAFPRSQGWRRSRPRSSQADQATGDACCLRERPTACLIFMESFDEQCRRREFCPTPDRMGCSECLRCVRATNRFRWRLANTSSEAAIG